VARLVGRALPGASVHAVGALIQVMPGSSPELIPDILRHRLLCRIDRRHRNVQFWVTQHPVHAALMSITEADQLLSVAACDRTRAKRIHELVGLISHLETVVSLGAYADELDQRGAPLQFEAARAER
jgi:hypothetical protein